jgi:hypothetical protein
MRSKRRVGWIALLLLIFTEIGSADMRRLRPVPQTIGEGDHTQLATQHSQLLEEGSMLCSRYSAYKQSCERPDSASPPPSDCAETLSRISSSLEEYNQRANSYNDAVVNALRSRVDEMGKAVSGDQQAIRNLGIHHDAEEFDAWTEWLKSEDSERRKQVDQAFRAAAKEFAIAAVQRGITAGVDAWATLSPREVARMVHRLEDLGVTDPLFLAAIQRFAAVRNKQEKAAAGIELLDRLRRAKGIWDLRDLGDDRESATWQAGSEILNIFVPEPDMQLIGTLTLNTVRAAFYNANEAWIDFPVFQSKIKGLEQLTAQHLNQLKALSDRLHNNVQRKKAAAKELEDIDQQPPDGGCN